MTRSATEVLHEQSLFDNRVSMTTSVVTIRVAANQQGLETKREYSFPAFGARNDAQARQATAVFRQMADGLASDSMRPHVATVGAVWQTRDEVAKTLLAALPPGFTLASNTVEEKVAGTTVAGGRRAVVLTSAGMMVLRAGTDSVAVTLRGYRLIDVATGLEIESFVGSTSTSVFGGKTQPASTVVTALTRTIR